MEALTFPIYGIIGGLALELIHQPRFGGKKGIACRHGSLAHFQYCMVICGRECTLTNVKGVFPMRLRWNFHRLMLGQSLSFYQDEFCRSCIGESDANCSCGTRYRHDHCGYAGVCCRLFYYFRLGACSFRYLVLVPFSYGLWHL